MRSCSLDLKWYSEWVHEIDDDLAVGFVKEDPVIVNQKIGGCQT